MEKVQQVQAQALEDIQACQDLQQLQQIRITTLGKKGPIQSLMTMMKDLSPEEKPTFGQEVNECKKAVAAAIEEKMAVLEKIAMNQKLQEEKIDITLPGVSFRTGTLHPLTLISQEIEDLFIGMGYTVAEGPEVELDFYNFERANIPADHPARDMQDTFYINPKELLRTHTTAIQMRELEKAQGQLPIKVICPGKVYRRDDDDATHSPMFTQMEGLVVDKTITLCDLKGMLEVLVQKIFGEGTTTRLRPSYFPFTEPSVEVDVSCFACGGCGCRLCKGTGWIEVLGAGIVNKKVLENCGIDSEEYSGLAFGIGIERLAMLKYGINNIKLLYQSDMRVLDQINDD